MSYWVKHSEDNHLPKYLKESLPSTCQYCNSPMMNYYNDDIRCTNRKCSNPSCYGFVAARGDFARKIIGVEGVGFASCLKDAYDYKASSPFELFRVWGFRPVVTVDQFLRIHCFEGVDSEWEKIVKSLNIYTIDELYERYDGKWKQLLIDNEQLIRSNLQYVVLRERPNDVTEEKPQYQFTIMITGTPIGYSSKEHFIETLNAICKGKILIIHQKTKRQSGVDFLIREPGSTTRGKVEAAKKGGIPIVTSEQFIGHLVKVLQQTNTEQ